MSDSEQDGPLVVWEMPVPRKQNGRYMWPQQIKDMAIQRVAAGETVAAIAREIPANESLIGKWVRDLRGDTSVQKHHPGLVEVLDVVDTEEPGQTSAATGMRCEIRIGDARRNIGPGYPTAHLAEILRAVSAACSRAAARAIVNLLRLWNVTDAEARNLLGGLRPPDLTFETGPSLRPEGFGRFLGPMHRLRSSAYQRLAVAGPVRRAKMGSRLARTLP